jgi:uncharacterized protein
VTAVADLSGYGPWAVITGASSGISRAFAKCCASDGLNVVLSARSSERLEELGRTIRRRTRPRRRPPGFRRWCD